MTPKDGYAQAKSVRGGMTYVYICRAYVLRALDSPTDVSLHR
jgi:hypothetical protein